MGLVAQVPSMPCAKEKSALEVMLQSEFVSTLLCCNKNCVNKCIKGLLGLRLLLPLSSQIPAKIIQECWDSVALKKA